MTEESRRVYLFEEQCPLPDKFTIYYDKEKSMPKDSLDVHYGWGEAIDMNGKHLVFKCPGVKGANDENKLRSFDLHKSSSLGYIFVRERLLDTLSELMGKDIQLLPSELYTPKGLVSGFHLIDVVHTVSGVDRTRSMFSEFTGCIEKLVPKDEDFMQGHALAREATMKGYIYITPSLREKLLKIKFKGLWMPTTKEYYELLYNAKMFPY